MPIMQLDELKAGMILDQDILNKSQIVVLGQGTVLTDSHIESLYRLDVDFVFVRDEHASSSGTINEVIRKKDEERMLVFEESVFQMEKISEAIKLNQKLSYYEIFGCVEKMVKIFYEYDDVMDVLENIRSDIPYSLSHAPAMTVISILLGKWLKIDHQQLYHLATGAYLSSIGLFKVPDDIINAPRKLDFKELESIRKHIGYGIDILIRSGGFPEEVISIVAQYHERCDGNGYPYMIDQSDIGELPKIVAVADVFHSLLCDRPYRSAYNVFEATKMIWEMSYNELDIKVSERLVKFMASFWMGRKVKLSTGEMGEIVMINRYDYFKPLVKVGDKFIDLSVDDSFIVGEQV